MKKLIINTLWTYFTIVLILFSYLSLVTIKISNTYDIDIQAFKYPPMAKEGSKADENVVYFNTPHPIPAVGMIKKVVLKYHVIVNRSKVQRSLTGSSDLTRSMKGVYQFSLNQPGDEKMNLQDCFDASIVVESDQPVYAVILKKILNPFL